MESIPRWTHRTNFYILNFICCGNLTAVPFQQTSGEIPPARQKFGKAQFWRWEYMPLVEAAS